MVFKTLRGSKEVWIRLKGSERKHSRNMDRLTFVYSCSCSQSLQGSEIKTTRMEAEENTISSMVRGH